MKLNETNIKLTDKEKRVLNSIRSQGSFFEEAGGNEEVRANGTCFFGWEVRTSDVGFNPSGVVASLEKKGIISTIEDGITGYYINYELEFDSNDYIIFD